MIRKNQANYQAQKEQELRNSARRRGDAGKSKSAATKAITKKIAAQRNMFSPPLK